MGVIKRVLCRQRLRQVPAQFSWIDHRLVRDRHISRCSANALALYLFLVTVADGKGLSYYSDQTVCRLLPLDGPALAGARRELIAAGLIGYERPLYQVLALDAPGGQGDPAAGPAGGASSSSPGQPMSLGQVLRAMERDR